MQADFKTPHQPMRLKKGGKNDKSEEGKKDASNETKASPVDNGAEKNNSCTTLEQDDQKSVAGASKDTSIHQPDAPEAGCSGDNVQKPDLSVVKIEVDSDCAMEASPDKKAESENSGNTKEDISSMSNKLGNIVDMAPTEKNESNDIKVKVEEGETLPGVKELGDGEQPAHDSVCTAVASNEEEEEEDEDDEDLRRLSESDKNINIDPKTYCKLGHFHLLLEDYPKGTNFESMSEI